MGYDSTLFLRDGSTNLTASTTAPAASGANKGPISLMTGLPRKGYWLKAWTKSQITGTNAVATIHSTTPPTGGTYTLTLGGQTTAALPYTATTTTVQNALAALATPSTPVYINGRNYTALVAGTDVTASTGAISAGDMVFTFAGVLQAQPIIQQFSMNGAALTGNTATALTTTTAGMDIVIQMTDSSAILESSGKLHINGSTRPFQDMAVLVEVGQTYNLAGGKPLTSVNYAATVTGTPVNAPIIVCIDETMTGYS